MKIANSNTKELYAQAVLALRQAEYQVAIELTEQIIDIEPEHAKAHAVQFSSLFKSNQHERARQMGGKAAELNPESLFLLNNQACLQLDAKQPAAAAGLLRSLINQFGERAQWLYNLALAQRMVGNLDNAISAFRQTLKNDPEHDRAAFQLAECYLQCGDLDNAANAFDYVRMLRAKHAQSHSQSIHMGTICNSFSTAELKQELRLWNNRFIPKALHYPNSEVSEKTPIKLGFILGELPRSWLDRIVIPLLNALAAGNDKLHLYLQTTSSNIAQIDDRVLQRSNLNISDSEFARIVRDDRIDVLIDLAGMRVGNRQRALGLGLATKQFSWLGHLGVQPTTAISALETKLGTKQFAVSQSSNAAVTPFPRKTLAAIGTGLGLSSRVILTWATILKSLPDWQLHFDCESIPAQKFFVRQFKSLGIESDRLIFDPTLAPGEGAIALDNFDCNDPVAVYDALVNQACVVLMQGRHFPAQQSALMFRQVSFESLVTHNTKQYLDRALALASGAQPLVSASSRRIKKSELQNLAQFAKTFRKKLTE